jgi:alpha-L-rhamnosidase
MVSFEKIFLKPSDKPQDSNIIKAYEIENACWVWHPDCPKLEEVTLLFRNEFELDSEKEILVHLSADQRYEFFINGELVSIGPDRSDVDHWSFASYRIIFPAGGNTIETLVWWIGEKAPRAQISHRGGFIFSAEGEFRETLNTGKGNWDVKKISGSNFSEPLSSKFVGYNHIIDGNEYFADAEFLAVEIIEDPISDNIYAIKRDSWGLYPTSIPDQILTYIHVGKVRAFFPEGLSENDSVKKENLEAEENSVFQTLIDGSDITIAACSKISVLVDLENYYCAYPVLKISGGKNAILEVKWSEGLFVHDGERYKKNCRDAIENKKFIGINDTFISDGGYRRVYKPCWWRSGRYLLLTVKTEDDPLTIHSFQLLETRYPLEYEGDFSCDEINMMDTIPLLVRGMQMCSHETFMDCPYYEQLMYVGDTRVEMLINYVMSNDDRLVKRGIQLFDWSRQYWGVVREHFPGFDYQLSVTFSMIYVKMVADFALWRDEPEWVKKMLPGVRCNLEYIRKFQNENGLLENLAGWSFVDWVPEWRNGIAPDGTKVSAINNLFFVMALKASAFLEKEFGDPVLVQRDLRDADLVSRKIIEEFWDEERGLLADDLNHKYFSEHAQSLALLYNLFEGEREQTVFENLIIDDKLSRTTIYFSFYLLETLQKYGRGDLIIPKFEFWKKTVDNGLKTPVEMPEPTRSDCHAWGSHPLFHYFASIAGIRPSSTGFKEIIIAPLPGTLKEISCVCPHPKGEIKIGLTFGINGGCKGTVFIPECAKGMFHWNNRRIELLSGKENRLEL